MASLHVVPSGPDDDDADVTAGVAEQETGPPPDPETTGEPEGGSESADPPEDEPPLEERRYPSTIGGAFYLSILTVACVAIAVAARSDWRLGIQILGGALVAGALLRLMLARQDAGMLAVRNRFVDAVLLGGVGVALIVLATSIPDMPAA